MWPAHCCMHKLKTRKSSKEYTIYFIKYKKRKKKKKWYRMKIFDMLRVSTFSTWKQRSGRLANNSLTTIYKALNLV